MMVPTVRFYTRGVRAVHKPEHLSAVFGSITPLTPVRNEEARSGSGDPEFADLPRLDQ
jgi:hypothetical protein